MQTYLLSLTIVQLIFISFEFSVLPPFSTQRATDIRFCHSFNHIYTQILDFTTVSMVFTHRY